jgi:putative SOS response-associated peptidase YedK
MCGRFALSAKTKDIEKLIPGFKIRDDFKPRFNISPSQQIASVLNTEDKELFYTRWGLIPSWAKADTNAQRIINARSESLLEKPTFRNLLKKKRCVIFADAFYEWKKIEGSKSKIPYLFKLSNNQPFLFAGLWDSWTDPEGHKLYTSTIITTHANELVTSIHHRMPVILQQEHVEHWLSSDDDSITLSEYLLPYSSEKMESYQVSNTVNNPANDTDNCIQPIADLFQ